MVEELFVQGNEACAKGAIKAAKFLVGKKPGLYRMKEVLS